MSVIVSGNLFSMTLKKLIEQRIEDKTRDIVSGIAIHNIEEYREAVGKVQALKEVLELMDEAEEIVSKTR